MIVSRRVFASATLEQMVLVSTSLWEGTSSSAEAKGLADHGFLAYRQLRLPG